MHYFAYGSNCNPVVMQRKGVRYRSRQSAVLAGYQMLFNKKSMKPDAPKGTGFANINPEEGYAVEGVLYEIVPEDLPLLDLSERYPDHYTRIEVEVETATGLVTSFAYRAQPDKVAPRLIPTREYLNHLLAAKEFFSEAYFAKLMTTETYAIES